MAKSLLNLDTDDEKSNLNLDEFKPKTSKEAHNIDEKHKIEQAAQESGFPSRVATKTKRKSAYNSQINLKIRDEMKDLFADITHHLKVYNHTTIERAIGALIENDDSLKQFRNRYNKIVNKDKLN